MRVYKSIFIVNEIVGAPSYKIAEARCVGKENTRGWYAGKAAIDLVCEIKRVSSKISKELIMKNSIIGEEKQEN